MQSRTFHSALRATLRTCFVAAAATSSAYAEWHSPAYAIPYGCFVHDSGLEFIPARFQTPEIDPLARTLTVEPQVETEATRQPKRLLDPVSDCALLAVRFENQQRFGSALAGIRQLGLSSLNGVQRDMFAGYLQASRVWESKLRTSATSLALGTNNAPSTVELLCGVPAADPSDSAVLPVDDGFDDGWNCNERSSMAEIVAGTDCPWDRSESQMVGPPYHPGTNSVVNSEYDEEYDENDLGLLPSGNRANIFLFTYEVPGPSLAKAFLGRDYCIFAPEFDVEQLPNNWSALAIEAPIFDAISAQPPTTQPPTSGPPVAIASFDASMFIQNSEWMKRARTVIDEWSPVLTGGWDHGAWGRSMGAARLSQYDSAEAIPVRHATPLSAEPNPSGETGTESNWTCHATAPAAPAALFARPTSVRQQRIATRQLARGMEWLGNALLDWSANLESSIRIAEASEGPVLGTK